VQRSEEWQRKRLTNLLHDKLHILIHFMIAKANHAITAFQEPRRAPRIILRGRILKMLRPIKFDDETFGYANEVDDVRAERHLPPELVAARLPGS
jgi:hypothetical protein